MQELELQDDLLNKPPVRCEIRDSFLGCYKAKLYYWQDVTCQVIQRFVRVCEESAHPVFDAGCLVGQWQPNPDRGNTDISRELVPQTVTATVEIPTIGMSNPIHWTISDIRFQDKGMRYLHYVDSVVKIPIRPGLEDLPERSKLCASASLSVFTGCFQSTCR